MSIKKISLVTAAKQLGTTTDELSLLLSPGTQELTIDQLEHLAKELAARKNQSLIVSKQNTLDSSSVEEVRSNVADYVDAGFDLPSLDVVAARAFFDRYRQIQASELGRLNAEAVFDLQRQEEELHIEQNDQVNTQYLASLKDSTEELRSKTQQLRDLKSKERSVVTENMSTVVSGLPPATQELLKKSPLYSHLFSKEK